MATHAASYEAKKIKQKIQDEVNRRILGGKGSANKSLFYISKLLNKSEEWVRGEIKRLTAIVKSEDWVKQEIIRLRSKISPRQEYDWDIDTNFYEGQDASKIRSPQEPRKPVIPTEPPKDLHLEIQKWIQKLLGANVGRIDLMWGELDAELKVKLTEPEFANMFYKALRSREFRNRFPVTIAVTRPGPNALQLLKKYDVPFIHLDWFGTKKMNILSGTVQNQKTQTLINTYNQAVSQE